MKTLLLTTALAAALAGCGGADVATPQQAPLLVAEYCSPCSVDGLAEEQRLRAMERPQEKEQDESIYEGVQTNVAEVLSVGSVE